MLKLAGAHKVTWVTETIFTATARDVVGNFMYPHSRVSYVEDSIRCSCWWRFKGSWFQTEQAACKHLTDTNLSSWANFYG